MLKYFLALMMAAKTNLPLYDLRKILESVKKLS